jgi:hypothetical protein
MPFELIPLNEVPFDEPLTTLKGSRWDAAIGALKGTGGTKALKITESDPQIRNSHKDTLVKRAKNSGVLLDVCEDSAAIYAWIKAEPDKFAENYIAALTEGEKDDFHDGWDVRLRNGYRLQVKWSSLQSPTKYNTKRWNWVKLLGLRDDGDYDYLVLVGKKDPRSHDPYPSDRFALFLVERKDVKSPLCTWNRTTLSTIAQTPDSEKLAPFRVSEKKIKSLSSELRPSEKSS